MSIPKLTDISTAWVAALEADATLTAWCQTTFGVKPALFNGVDPRNLPNKDACPFIVVDPDAASTGLFAEAFKYRLAVMVCVAAERGGVVASGDGGRVRTYAAQAQAEHLAGLALNALAGTDYIPEFVEAQVLDAEYPLVMVALTIETETEAVPLTGGRTW